MKTSNQEKRTFDLADLIFTKDNENEGVWVEPELFGVKIGVEFKVIGANCDKLITVIEEFNKKYAEVSAIKDTTERAKALDELYVDTAAKRTIGLRCAADAEVTIEGKPVEYSDAVVRHIFEKSPVCAQFIVMFSRNTEKFYEQEEELEKAVKQYFFLYYPYKDNLTVVKKDGVKEKKTIYKRHIEEREKFIEQMGKEKFDNLAETSERFARLKDIPFPTRYSWIWGHFLAIWGQCETDMAGNRIFSFRTINEYVECMKVPLSVVDKRILFKMKMWANEQISEMKEKEK